MNWKKLTVKSVAKWITVAALSVAMCEISLRVWGFEPIYGITIKGLPEDRGHLKFSLDSHRLYRMRPWPNTRINSWGFRDVEFSPPKEGIARAVVVGDSFPMGLAVLPEKTFPKLLPSFISRPSEVLNLGIQGYGPDQEYDLIQRELLALKPRCVIWSVFPGNDFGDVMRNRLYAPRNDGVLERLTENWVSENMPQYKLFLALNVLRFGSFFSPEAEAELDADFFQDKVKILYDETDPWRSQGVPVTQSLFIAGKKFLEAAGVRLVAVITPSIDIIQDDTKLLAAKVPREVYFSNEKLAADALSRAGIPFVDLSPHFVAHRGAPLYEVTDRHLSEEGHRVAAQFLAPLVEACLQEDAPRL